MNPDRLVNLTVAAMNTAILAAGLSRVHHGRPLSGLLLMTVALMGLRAMQNFWGP